MSETKPSVKDPGKRDKHEMRYDTFVHIFEGVIKEPGYHFVDDTRGWVPDVFVHAILRYLLSLRLKCHMT
jgi:hypothetical protein